MSKRTLKLTAYLIITALLVVGVGYTMRETGWNALSPAELKKLIDGFGIFGPIVFIILFTLVPLTLFPDAILAIAAGMTFGLLHGTLYTMLGAISGATLSFYLSRWLGKDFIRTLIKKDLSIPGFSTAKRGFLMILVLRLIPLFPFDVISYGAGLSKIKLGTFLSATFVGIIPGVIVYVNLGDKSANPCSMEFICSLILLLMIFIASFYLKKRYSSRLRADL